MKRYAYGWITALFFLITITGHWIFGWFAYIDEQKAHNQSAQVGPYIVEMTRDTLENWQSEFLQLLWQVVGLAYFLYVGSPSSKENDDRTEAKIDEIIRLVGGNDADARIAEIDHQFLRTHGHALPQGHGES